MNIKSLLFLLFASVLSQNLQAQTQKKQPAQYANLKSTFVPNGTWRGTFKIKPDVEVPFNFEINAKNTGKAHLTFLNAEERFDGGIVNQTTDSIFIKLDQFDNELAFKIEGDSLVGVLRKQDQSGKPLTVVASRGTNYRFKTTGKAPTADFSGTYDVAFKSPNGKDENAVGLFKQNGNKITGTFLRVTGDSRYLEGIIEGNDFYLSSFIGSSPSYYKGTFSTDGTIKGEAVSARGNIEFSGNQNQNAALPDAYKLTFLKEGYKTLDFSFPDVNGKKISLSDEKFKNKVVILTITGTWCPNCVDEASFIAPWYKENRNRGVEVIAIHYERQLDSAYVKKALTRFREKFDIQYDQVIAGKPDKQLVAESLPALNNFLSFPTTIIINKKGEVAQIHTGYSGPATGKYYTDFVKEFNAEINSLLEQ
ncbi:TlpA family protein disulfide reductase [Pedobacter chinensis]|uniref:TlpA family protein disulfide reductase n=1 Tax=Pedobacter chinensis TaxID=2282421 RepID=A0A369Q3K9_9SPHI|nr:TlpA disulfide reductase family protein [Pedobacter chinensis]RDC57837.1 TlpA family protein disulfide reductase [Pedobacter chinensis]